MYNTILDEVIAGNNLEQKQAELIMKQIMQGNLSSAQIAGIITALRMKGETADEITGCARIMREFAENLSVEGELVDTCGTGGDGTGTFNISTTAAFVVAAAGLKVAKHGNRSVSSKSGSADLLEEMGVKIDLEPEIVADSIRQIGIGFLYAPCFHKAMKYAVKPRKELGIRTIFNVLGPLTNPARAKYQVLGVYSSELCELMAEVLKNLGISRALVVHGKGGLDEISLLGETIIVELSNGKLKKYSIHPRDFGFKKAKIKDIRGGNARVNAEITKKILRGENGPRRDITLLNAGAAIYVANKARNINEGVAFAKEAVDSGKAWEKVMQLCDFSNSSF